MKTITKTGLTLLTAIALMAVAATNTVKAQPGMSVSFQLFYDELAPYGEWINDPQHGYIWLPNAEPGFQPYASNGYWVMTTYGNTWVSNYSWGWAPFHYGRWTYTDYYGWAWVPGYEWGPAWVSWRSGGGYYGWAPLGPRMSINVHIGIPHNHWVFVQQRYICSPRLYSYYVPYRNRTRIYNHTTIINNTYVYNNRTYVSGPRRSEIERATGSRVAVREVSHASRPGRAAVNSRSVSLYRPAVDRNSRTSARPSQVGDAATVRTATRRDNGRATVTPAATTSTNATATRGTSARSTETRGAAARTSDRNDNTVRATGATRTRETATSPATQARTTAPKANTVRQAGNTARSTANRGTTAAPQSRATSSTPRAASSNRVSSQRQPSSASRNSSVSNRTSQSRPSVSTARSSERSSGSTTRSRSSERNGSAGRGSR